MSASRRHVLSWLEVDTYSRLASLTYLGFEDVEGANLSCLVGRYDAQLNSLTRLFNGGHIHDFIECVHVPWIT